MADGAPAARRPRVGPRPSSAPGRPRVLLINPTMTAARHARFPLALLHLAAALQQRFEVILLDGNHERDFLAAARRSLGSEPLAAVGISVMGGPQLPGAIAVSRLVRELAPGVPIIWGGAFATTCPDAALGSDYVDYCVRAQGEETFAELLECVAGGTGSLERVQGLSWRRDGRAVHNANRAFSAAPLAHELPYALLGDPARYLGRTFLGSRTAGHQAALGCRFRCTFCGVATMFRGKTALPGAGRLETDLGILRDMGADSIQFYDHNFFERETDMVPLLEVLARFALPWWCYARADALVGLSARSWELVKRSNLRMAYIGAESPSEWMLHDIRKGTHADQTLAAVETCHAHGVVPELSFMLAPPQDPEGETERTFEFIRLIKRRFPRTEIILYVYTPLPPRPGSNPPAERAAALLRDADGAALQYPTSPEGWAAEQWQAYWCHADAPWLTPRLRARIRDFTTVLGCRYPTLQDTRSPPWAKSALRRAAAWRYRYRIYARPWELALSRRLIRLMDPRVSSL